MDAGPTVRLWVDPCLLKLVDSTSNWTQYTHTPRLRANPDPYPPVALPEHAHHALLPVTVGSCQPALAHGGVEAGIEEARRHRPGVQPDL